MHVSSFLLGTYLWVELLNHKVTLRLTVRRIVRRFSIMALPFYIPTSSLWSSDFSSSSPTLVIIWLYDYSFPRGCEVVSCGFIFTFCSTRYRIQGLVHARQVLTTEPYPQPYLVVLMCISVMIHDVKCFFMCLFTMYTSYPEKCIFRSFVLFLNWAVIFF